MINTTTTLPQFPVAYATTSSALEDADVSRAYPWENLRNLPFSVSAKTLWQLQNRLALLEQSLHAHRHLVRNTPRKMLASWLSSAIILLAGLYFISDWVSLRQIDNDVLVEQAMLHEDIPLEAWSDKDFVDILLHIDPQDLDDALSSKNETVAL